MDKAVYGGSISIALVLIAGSYFVPNDSMMWLASTSLFMNIARVIIIGLMLTLVFTDPPRRKELRQVIGFAALVFAGWSAVRLFSGTVQVVDALLFMSAAVSFALAAVEAPVPIQKRVPDSAFAEMIESAVARGGEMTLRQRLAVSLLALQLLYNAREFKPRWLDVIVHHTNGRIANAHSP